MPPSPSDRKRAGWVLAASLFGISVAGPLVRFSGADPVAIAIGRIGFSLLAVAVLLVATGEWRQWRALRLADWALALACGVILAFHFWWWNASIHLTTIAASTTLVTSVQPACVALLSILIVSEIPTRRQFVGLSIATLGALIITLPDLLAHAPSAPSTAPNPLLGNLLSIGAGAAGAAYITIGRRLRGVLGAWAYVGIVYGASFVTLLVIAGITGVHVAPQPPRELLIFAALAVGPMLIGHTGMNWALEHLPAYVVNLTMLGEPVGATLLGMVLPGIHEIPRWTTLAGGAVVLAGAVLTAAAQAPVKDVGIEAV
ncbi:MAG TPA: DMT family transporter [Candidatus Elarobacter sp.]|nr:DMT family transporter [Candidatus Elarobacter sp.]